MLPNKDLLTPGPWRVRGNTVIDGYGKTIAVCFARNATAHAYWIAEVPAFANAHPTELESELMMLRSRVAMLERENEGLYKELEDRVDSGE